MKTLPGKTLLPTIFPTPPKNLLTTIPSNLPPDADDRPHAPVPRNPLDYNNPVRTGKYLTKYERARVIGTRATQISLNAPLFVETEGETDPMIIAEMELRAGKIPFFLQRRLPSGAVEQWRVCDLIDPDF